MIKADRLVAGSEEEQRVLADSCAEDRPLAVQFCGRDPAILARAVRQALNSSTGQYIDAFDLNLGCPQRCAEEGGWGAYLQEEPELASACVRAMVEAAAPENRPVWCKIRIQTTAAETIAYGLRLQAAGCSLLAVHCRGRPTNRDVFHDTVPDYSQLLPLVSNLKIPVVANGGIDDAAAAAHIEATTGCHAAMAATSLLRCPKAFASKTQASPCAESGCAMAIDVAREYLALAERFPPPSALFISKHLRWIFRAELQPAYATATATAKMKRGSEKERRELLGDTAYVPDQSVPSSTWDDWRARVWKFLARPDLKQISQFKDVTQFIAAHASGDERELAAAKTLKEIRLGSGSMQTAGGRCSAPDAADQFGCADLFDHVEF
jgi:tRNA-dihydrouridine synthase